jgi:hypothetical protein
MAEQKIFPQQITVTGSTNGQVLTANTTSNTAYWAPANSWLTTVTSKNIIPAASNTYNLGSPTGGTGNAIPNFSEGIVYKYGDIVTAYDGYIYKSVVNSNTTIPDPPSSGSSDFWEEVLIDGPIDEIPDYNFTVDYNLYYHQRGGAPILVQYKGKVWTWKLTYGVDYSTTNPILAPLIKYGFVIGVEPPPPEPFNPWVLIYFTQPTTINPYTGDTIYEFSKTIPYRGGDIVVYGGFFWRCTGSGYGPALMEDGTYQPTQLYVSSKEIDFGRVLYDPTSKSRFNEVFVTTDGVNENLTVIPKWGDGLIDDPWNSAGFARSLRYEFASTFELTYCTLKSDR